MCKMIDVQDEILLMFFQHVLLRLKVKTEIQHSCVLTSYLPNETFTESLVRFRHHHHHHSNNRKCGVLDQMKERLKERERESEWWWAGLFCYLIADSLFVSFCVRFQSERESGDRNFAIGYYLKEKKVSLGHFFGNVSFPVWFVTDKHHK